MTDEMDSMTSGIDGNWWLRWYGSDGFDFTLHWPWWVSGYAGDSTVLVAAVRATSEEVAALAPIAALTPPGDGGGR